MFVQKTPARAAPFVPVATRPQRRQQWAAYSNQQVPQHRCQQTERRAWRLRAQAQEQEMEDKRAGRATYRPSSYSELVQDAVAAVIAAMGDGLNRLEVEFPAVSNVDGASCRSLPLQPVACSSWPTESLHMHRDACSGTYKATRECMLLSRLATAELLAAARRARSLRLRWPCCADGLPSRRLQGGFGPVY